MNLEYQTWIDLGEIGQLRAVIQGSCTSYKDYGHARKYSVLIDSVDVEIAGVKIDVYPLIKEWLRDEYRQELINLYDESSPNMETAWEMERIERETA